MLFLLLFFIFAALGIELFGGIGKYTPYNKPLPVKWATLLLPDLEKLITDTSEFPIILYHGNALL